jgi:hypothetical protein
MKSIDHEAEHRAAAARWLKGVADLTPSVEALFVKESSGRPKAPKNPPSQEGYRRVAGALMAVRTRGNAEPSDITRVDREEASKSARKFLRHLQPLRQMLLGPICDIETAGPVAAPMLAHYLASYNEHLELLYQRPRRLTHRGIPESR